MTYTTHDRLAVASGKVCSKCGTWKHYALFGADKSKRDGRGSWCRECQREYAYARQRARREAGLCHAFGCDQPRAEGRGGFCISHADERRDRRDPEKHHEWNTTYRARLSARTDEEIIAARAEKWPDDTKPCRSCGHTLPLAAFSDNRTRADGLHDKCRDCDATAKANRHQRRYAPAWEDADVYVCWLCRAPFEPGDKIHVEHVHAVSLGGHELVTAPAHAECNLSKGATNLPDTLDRWHPGVLEALADWPVVDAATGEVLGTVSEVLDE